MHTTYQAHLTLFWHLWHQRCFYYPWLETCKSKYETDSVPRPGVILEHAETPKATLQNTLQWFLKTPVCFPYVWIKAASSNSIQFFCHILCLLNLISVSLPFPYLFLPRSLSLNFLRSNVHNLRHLFGTFRVKETTVSEIKRAVTIFSHFPHFISNQACGWFIDQKKTSKLITFDSWISISSFSEIYSFFRFMYSVRYSPSLTFLIPSPSRFDGVTQLPLRW